MERLEDRSLLSGFAQLEAITSTAQSPTFGAVLVATDSTFFIADPDEGANAGAVYQYDRATTEPRRRIVAPNQQLFASFGRALAVNQQHLLVGAPGEARNAGTSYVYNAVTSEHVLTIANPTPADHDRFGAAVAIIGDTIVVGAPGDDTAGSDAGAVYLFNIDGSLRRSIFSPSLAGGFGTSVAALSSNKIAVSQAERQIGSQMFATGEVHVFDVTNPDLPAVVASFSSPNLPDPRGDRFGFVIAGMGGDVVVAAPLARDPSTGTENSGAVYIFDGTTAERRQDIVNPHPEQDGVNGAVFGSSLATHDQHLLVGAPGHDVGETINAGAAYLFIVPEDEEPRQGFVNPVPARLSSFGQAVAFVGDDLLVSRSGSTGAIGGPPRSSGSVFYYLATEGASGSAAHDLVGVTALRNDPLFAGIDGSGVSVAVIDTGVDLNHPLLAPGGLAARDIAAGIDRVSWTHPHGTHVAGIIGARDPQIGIAPGVGLIGLQVFVHAGNGELGAPVSNTEAALRWVLDHQQQYNIVAVNMSLGSGHYTSADQVAFGAYSDEIRALEAAGVTVVS
ncbi:MAG: S8 family serine peptidase, partial [Pirellulales bacterium]